MVGLRQKVETFARAWTWRTRKWKSNWSNDSTRWRNGIERFGNGKSFEHWSASGRSPDRNIEKELNKMELVSDFYIFLYKCRTGFPFFLGLSRYGPTLVSCSKANIECKIVPERNQR